MSISREFNELMQRLENAMAKSKDKEQQVSYEFTSEDSGKRYTLILGQDGVAYCTCPAWRFQKGAPKSRTCKHLKALERRTFEGGFTPHNGMVL